LGNELLHSKLYNETYFMNSTIEYKQSFIKRFYQYQKERFPFLANIVLIAAFTFSALSYSRISRGVEGFVSLKLYLIGAFTTVTLFLLVRIFDEHKDAEDDAKFRKELPVPRGLVTLKELRNVAILVLIGQIVINAIFVPKMLFLFFLAFGYLCFMGKEFFIGEWLKKRQLIYVFSHMLIIPLIDTYASGLDWLMEGANPPKGLLFFFGVSFMNGIVLEFGRKIRVPEKEKEGVVTYSAMYGANKASLLWMLSLFVTLVFSLGAAFYAGYGKIECIVLIGFFIVCSLPALFFIKNKTAKLSKMIEYASAAWTLVMYLTLGGIPMLIKLIFG